MNSSHRNNYLIKIHLTLLIGALILLYGKPFAELIKKWIHSFDYTYAFIIPLLSFYMVWQRRDSLKLVPISQNKSGLIIVIVAILLYIVGQATAVILAQQVSLIIILMGIVMYYFGFRMFRRLFVPLIILIFMLPYGDPLGPYLGVFYARICTATLQLFNAPVYTESQYIQLPNLVVEVAQACSGIRFMTAIIPIGFTLSWLLFRSRWKKLLIMFLSIVFPILANFFRVLSLLIFLLMGNEIFLHGVFHDIHGYIFFILGLLMLFGFTSLIKRIKPVEFKTQKETLKKIPGSRLWTQGFASLGNLILIALLLLVPGMVHVRLTTQPAIPLTRGFNSFPIVLGEWKGRDTGENEWYPEIIGATDKLHRQYTDGNGNKIKIFVSYMPIQNREQKITYSENQMIPNISRVMSRKVRLLNINSDSPAKFLKLNHFVINIAGHHHHLLFWYQNTHHSTANRILAKTYMALDSILLNRSNGAVFQLLIEEAFFNGEDDEIVLSHFLNHFMNEIEKYLPT